MADLDRTAPKPGPPGAAPEKPAADKSSTWSKRTVVPGAALIALLLILLFAWHTYERWEELNRHHQRQLARAAELLEGVVVNAATTVENACEHDVESFLEEQPYIVDVQANELRPRLRLLSYDETAPKKELAVDIGRVLQETPRPDSFEHLMLADAEGLVVRKFSRGEWTPPLLVVDLAATLAALDPPVDFAGLHGSSSQRDVVLGGERFQLYTQPVRVNPLAEMDCLSPAENGGLTLSEAREWMLVALAPYPELQRRSFSFETYMIGAMTLLPLIAVLGWPFVKLGALDPGERFGYRDVALLYLSTSALVSLLTVLALAGDSYRHFSDRGDERLVELSTRINQKLRLELSQAVVQLHEYDRQFFDAAGKGPCERQPCLLDPDCAAPPENGCRRLEAPQSYKNVDQVAWIDANGMQTHKASVSPPFKPLNVSERPYFRAVATKDLYELDGKDRAIFVHPSRSITTGRYYTFLSAESDAGTARRGEERPVDAEPPKAIVLTMNPAALNDQPLRPGYGFAIVDRDGEVLYHSDPRLPLRENLLAEVSDSLRLGGVISTGASQKLTLTYYARPHRFYVKPIEELTSASEPVWTLVTFRDLSIGRGAAVQALTLSVIWPLPILIGFGGAVLWAFSRVSRPHRGAWLWPHEGKRDRYLRLTFVLATLALITVSWDTIEGGVAVAVGVAVVLLLVMRRVPDSNRSPLKSLFWHRAFLVLVTLQLAVIPARGLFRAIWSHEFGKLHNYEQTVLAERMDAYRRTAMARFTGPEYLPHADTLLDERKRFHAWESRPTLEFRSSGWLMRWHQFVARQLPMHNETMAQTRYRDDVLDSPYPPVAGRWTLLAFLLALPTLLWWIRYNSNQVFFANVSNDGVEQNGAKGEFAVRTRTQSG